MAAPLLPPTRENASSDTIVPDNGKHDRGERFTRLLMENQRRLQAFVYVLVQDRTAIDDLIQDISVTLWQKFDDFQDGTNFLSWAMTVARFHVMNWRRKQPRLPLPLEDYHFSLLAEAAEELAHEADDHHSALRACLEQLTSNQRELLRQRYERDVPVTSIARSELKTGRAIYKKLARIRRLLMECIQQRLAESK